MDAAFLCLTPRSNQFDENTGVKKRFHPENRELGGNTAILRQASERNPSMAVPKVIWPAGCWLAGLMTSIASPPAEATLLHPYRFLCNPHIFLVHSRMFIS
jgi:hypothetical protein